MDTLAALRRLTTAGCSPDQADAIVAVVQDGVTGIPSTLEVRNFALNINANIEELRTDMHRSFDAFRLEMQEEFRRLHGRMDRLDDRLDDRLLLQDRALQGTTRLAWGMAGLAGLAGAVVLFALLR